MDEIISQKSETKFDTQEHDETTDLGLSLQNERLTNSSFSKQKDVENTIYNDIPHEHNVVHISANTNKDVGLSTLGSPNSSFNIVNMVHNVDGSSLYRSESVETDIDLLVPKVMEDKSSVDSDSNTNVKTFQRKKACQMDDIFDEELSDKDEKDTNGDHCELLEGGHVDIKDKNDISKYAAKTKKFQKQKEEELLRIYGENQRMMRESSINLPYHTTPKIILDNFLKERNRRVLNENANSVWNAPKMLGKETSLFHIRNSHTADSMNKVTNSFSKCPSDGQGDFNDLPDLLKAYRSQNELSSLGVENSSVICNKSNDLTVENSLKPKYSFVEAVHNIPTDTLDLTIENKFEKEDFEKCAKFSEVCNEDYKSHSNITKISQQVNSNSFVNQVSHLNAISNLDEKYENGDHHRKQSCTSNLEYSLSTDEMCKVENYHCANVNKKSLQDFNDGLKRENKQNTYLSVLKAKFLESAQSFKPHIRGEPTGIVDLNKNTTKPTEKNGIEQFMERFVQHNKPIEHSKKSHVQLSIVQKKLQTDGDTEMERNFVTFKLPHAEDNQAFTTPGAKLAYIKEQLWSRIKVKRREALQERKHAYQLDNEEIIGNEEIEETELTDENEEEEDELQSDTDSEEAAEVLGIEYRKKKHEFLDDEAEDEDSESIFSDAENSDIDFQPIDTVEKGSDSDTDGKDNLEEKQANRDSDVEGYLEHGSKGISQKQQMNRSNLDAYSPDKLKKQKNSDSDVELHSCNEEKLNTQNGIRDKTEYHSDSNHEDVLQKGANFGLHLESDSDDERLHDSIAINATVTKDNSFQLAEPTCLKSLQNHGHDFCIDDMASSHANKGSLRITPVTPAIYCTEGSQCLWPSQNFSLSPLASSPVEEWKSRLNKHGTSEHCSSAMKKLLGDNSGHETFNEVLALCSGQFTCTSSDDMLSNQSCKKDSPENLQSSTQDNMKELLDLCSGQFLDSLPVPNDEESSKDSSDVKMKRPHPRKLIVSDDEDDDLVTVEDHKGEEDDYINICKDNDNDNTTAITEFPSEKKNHILKEFLDEEAELSGSDIGSDEDFDIPEEEDQLEDDHILEDLPCEDELRSQIGRVHLKNLLDEDKQELRLFKEMYLEDGELHSDGQGRERKFRWRNIGNNVPEIGKCSDSENEIELEEDEKWRIERYEREKWIQEQTSKGACIQSPAQESKRKSSIQLEIVHSASDNTHVGNLSSNNFLVNPQSYLQKCPGSYVTRGKDYLSCLAQRLKKTDDGTAGSRTTRHFVFRAVSPQSCKARVRDSSPNYVLPPPQKRRKLKMIKKNVDKSVFDYLE